MKDSIAHPGSKDFSATQPQVGTTDGGSGPLARPPRRLHNARLWIHPAATVLWLVLMAAVCLPLSGQAQRNGVGGKRDLTVMTRNVYVGTDFGGILSLDPADENFPGQLVAAVTEAYYTILIQNDFNIRAEGIADEIVATSPDLVGLQEMSVIRVSAPGSSGSSGVVMIDYLEVILDALAARGAHYAAVSTGNNWSAELPFYNLATDEINFASLSDTDVILARTDLPPGYLKLSNAAHGNFENNWVIPELGLEFTRGWCSVDAFVRGRTFRFINTHLEQELFPELQWLQAQELLAGPANTPLPVVLVGDLNSDGNRQNGTFTYDGLLNAGFQDSWSVVHPRDAGLTWGHDGLLADPGVPFVWRIDLILYRGAQFSPQQAAVLDTPLSRTLPPFWSSDHAAVVANLLVK